MSSCGFLHLKAARQYYKWAIHTIEGNIHKLAAMFNMHIPTFPSRQQLLSLFYFCLSTSIVKILYLLGFQWFCLTFLIIIQPFHSSLHPTALIVVCINKWSDGDLHNCHKDCQKQHNSLRINIGRKERKGFSTERVLASDS